MRLFAIPKLDHGFELLGYNLPFGIRNRPILSLPKGPRLLMIRFMRLVSTPLAKAEWLRTGLLR